MQIEQLKEHNQIKKGDVLLISDGKNVISVTAKLVKITDYDGEEIIFNTKKNKYFNVGMYLKGESWAKDVRVVR